LLLLLDFLPSLLNEATLLLLAVLEHPVRESELDVRLMVDQELSHLLLLAPLISTEKAIMTCREYNKFRRGGRWGIDGNCCHCSLS